MAFTVEKLKHSLKKIKLADAHAEYRHEPCVTMFNTRTTLRKAALAQRRMMPYRADPDFHWRRIWNLGWKQND